MSHDNKSEIPFQEQKLFYDQRWENKRPVIDQRCKVQFIVPHIKQIRTRLGRPLKICDFGCGRGWLSAILSKYGDVLGIDQSISMAEKSFPKLKFKQANIITDHIEGQYDVVVSSEVIEHFEAQYQPIYLKKIYDLLEPNGYLILTTPNKPVIEESIKEDLQPVETWLDKDSLFSLLQPYFAIEAFSTTMFFPTFFRKYRPFNLMYSLFYDTMEFYRLLDKILARIWDGIYLEIVAKKAIKEDKST
jgi:2-polyprenyl-3-methyl-5-hydroxy-6-metoxy-1,4-benzoquinol methylase